MEKECGIEASRYEEGSSDDYADDFHGRLEDLEGTAAERAGIGGRGTGVTRNVAKGAGSGLIGADGEVDAEGAGVLVSTGPCMPAHGAGAGIGFLHW